MKLKWKKALLIKQHVLNKKWINPFHANVAFQYPLKTSENLTGLFLYPLKTSENQRYRKRLVRFSFVFRGYRNGTLAWKGLTHFWSMFIPSESTWKPLLSWCLQGLKMGTMARNGWSDNYSIYYTGQERTHSLVYLAKYLFFGEKNQIASKVAPSTPVNI